MKEMKVKAWVIDKAQRTAENYNVFIDYTRRNDDIMKERTEEDGYIFVRVEEEISETEKAVQVRFGSGDVVGSVKGWKLWIPKSQIAWIQ